MDDINKYLSVGSLTKYLKYKIDTDEHLQNVYLKGEISNFKSHSSGHFYFSLKDDKSKINAIMFKNQNSKLKFTPTDGMKVLVKGRISIYEQMGSYQIYIEEMNEDGLGDLYLAYEQLKEKLEKEGFFKTEHKKSIPKFPNKIGVITAQTGAAVRDIISTLKRRYPIADVYLFPCLVQGKEAYLDIIKKLQQADQFDLDVIILGRGGGSIEDLWAFNEEALANEIFNAKTPIISGVGHQIDFTIADFVADLRAPTPTAAAELAVPNIIDLIKNIENFKNRINEAINQKINYQKLVLDSIKNSYVLKNPLIIYESKKQHLDNLIEKINQNIKEKITYQKNHLLYLKNNFIFKKPHKLYEKEKTNLITIIQKLELLNPMYILARGYSVTYFDNKIIKNIDKIKKDDIIITQLNNGNLISKIIEKEKKNGKKQQI